MLDVSFNVKETNSISRLETLAEISEFGDDLIILVPSDWVTLQQCIDHTRKLEKQNKNKRMNIGRTIRFRCH